MVVAPNDELAQVELVGGPGEAAVTGEEPPSASRLGSAKAGSNGTTAVVLILVIVHLPSQLRPGGRSDRAPAIRSSHVTPSVVTQAEVPICVRRPGVAAVVRRERYGCGFPGGRRRSAGADSRQLRANRSQEAGHGAVPGTSNSLGMI
jgi:hypothetical protein